MKKTIRFFSLLAIFTIAFGAINNQVQAQNCDSKESKARAIMALTPFYYASAKISSLTYETTESVKEIEVPLFKGEKYKLVFNREDLGKMVQVEVYDKPRSESGRELLFSSAKLDKNVEIFSYEPDKSKDLFINYIIPASDSKSEEGCMIFVLGYQLNF